MELENMKTIFSDQLVKLAAQSATKPEKELHARFEQVKGEIDRVSKSPDVEIERREFNSTSVKFNYDESQQFYK